jgi:hypothetical protein
LRSIVFLNVRGRDMGGFVTEAKKTLEKQLRLPAGYYVGWSGQWENQVKMQQRMKVLIPMGLLIIFILLYFTFHSALEASMVMLSVPFALVGGVFMVYALHYNLSTAVWVGFIALYGIAVETGVVMVIYLHEALDKKLIRGTGHRAGYLRCHLRGCRAAPQAEAHDSGRRPNRPGANHVVHRHRCRRHEADSRADDRRYDLLGDTRPDNDTDNFCDDEDT